MKKLLPILFVIITSIGYSQNVAITDDNGYSADPSAMLDVKSLTKGMLVPRLTTAQRTAISAPATGLLVFDTTVGSFFFHTGSDWVSLSNSGEIWTKSGNNVYTTANTDKVGVGTSTPIGKLEVKADGTIAPHEPIFEVLNANGDTVFAVYPEGVRINVDDNTAKAVGSKGGFAVGGFSQAKGYTNEFLRVTPDSVRIYIDDDFTQTKASGSRGGFAVGGFSNAKGSITDNYLFVQDDSSRVWTNGNGGFEITDRSTGANNYMDLNPINYFIGHQSGQFTTGPYNAFIGFNAGANNKTGQENVFIGFQSGLLNESGNWNTFLGTESGLSSTGSYNTFLGYHAGYENTTGTDNLFVGTAAGWNNTIGTGNSFVGRSAGQNNTIGGGNVFLGSSAGIYNTEGGSNTFIGYASGRNNLTGNSNVALGYYNATGLTSGSYNIYIGESTGNSGNGSSNVMIGHYSGFSTTGSGNIFIGYEAGRNELGSNKLYIDNSDISTPLIYGDFSTNRIDINGDFQPKWKVFDQSGDAGTSGQVLSSTGTGTNWITLPTGLAGTGIATQIAFWTNGSTLSSSGNLYWDNSNQRLGIWTSSPTEALHVNGGIRLGFSTNLNPGTMQWNGTDFYGYNGTSWVSMTKQGDITSVTAGNGLSGGGTTGDVTLTIGAGDGIDVAATTVSVDVTDFLGTGMTEDGSNNLMAFSLCANDGSPTNALYVRENGWVGIGTLTPYEPLQVNGALIVGSAVASNYGTIQWNGSDFTGYTPSGWKSLTAQGTVTGSGTNTNIAFWNGTSSLSSNGNLNWDNSNSRLGIGITPSYNLHVNSNGIGTAFQAQYSSTIFGQIGASNTGVYGTSTTNSYAYGISGNAIYSGSANSAYTYGGYFNATGGTQDARGIYATASSNASAYGIYSTASGSGTLYAAYFQGDVHVNGTLSKNAGTFRIDHPQDPENKYLVHSFVESPDMMNIYNGTIILDNEGRAVVVLPSYFEALNTSFRYNLTPIGAPSPNLYIAQEVSNNQFIIAGGEPGTKISWQVTGVRQDPYAQEHPIVVEENKKPEDRGKYLNPQLYNQPGSKAIHNPQPTK